VLLLLLLPVVLLQSTKAKTPMTNPLLFFLLWVQQLLWHSGNDWEGGGCFSAACGRVAAG
jgi:hypothetical protein